MKGQVLPVLLLCLPGVAGLAAGTVKSVNSETGLIGWKLAQGHLQVELIQRLPDQTRAFFLARGFPAKFADELGRACIFQAIVRNAEKNLDMPLEVSVDLRQWRVVHDGRQRALRLKQDWDAAWPADEVGKAARLAFRWATFPVQQTFLPGDYNWGMISFGLPPATHFDVHLRWQENGKPADAVMRDLVCAEDR